MSLDQEQELIGRIKLQSVDVIQTPKTEPADIDGFVVKDGTIVAVLENKCRNMTTDILQKFGNEWLVTYEKIAKGADVAKRLRVPFVGALYLIPDNKVLLVTIADKMGNLLPRIRIQRSKTQETINGGEIVRTNAYISMDGAKEI